MEASILVKEDMGNEDNKDTKDEVNPQDECPSNKTRSNNKKKDREDSPNDIQLISEETKNMEV